MSIIKFKIYDSKKNEIVDYVNCSIAIDGGIQSFGRDGSLEGTLKNRHLVPLLYTGKQDITSKEIYDGFIVKREAMELGDEEITGVVVFDECSWWIENRKEKRVVLLFSETAVDQVIGNVLQNKELAEELGF